MQPRGSHGEASTHRDADYDCRISGRAERWLDGQALSGPLVRPCDVEIVEAVLLQHVLEVPLAEEHDVIETVAPDAPEKSLANTRRLAETKRRTPAKSRTPTRVGENAV